MIRLARVSCIPAVALVALSAGCVPQMSRTPLADAHRKAIVTSKIVANVPQERVETSIEGLGLAGGLGSLGVLGVLLGSAIDAGVENSRATKAEARVRPLRDAMAGYDARATVETVLAAELAGVPTFRGAKLELQRDRWLTETDTTAILDGAGTDAVLVVKIRYWLSPKFDRIEVLALAAIYPTKAAADAELRTLSGQPSIVDFQPCPALYRNDFRATFPAPNGGGIDGWSADNGAAAKAAIDTGIGDIARMLAWDLDQPGPTGSTYDVPGVKAAVYEELGTELAWHVIDTKNGRTWLRARTGELMTIPEAKPDVAPATAAAK